jgi:hypothetical protein
MKMLMHQVLCKRYDAVDRLIEDGYDNGASILGKAQSAVSGRGNIARYGHQCLDLLLRYTQLAVVEGY